MPESRHRDKSHQHAKHAPEAAHPHVVKKRSAAVVLAIIAGILGLIVSYITQGADVKWMVVGTAIGAFAGFLIGRSMDKSMER